MIKHLALLVLVFASIRLHAQNNKQDIERGRQPILKALLQNNWTGTGVLMGNEATFRMEWQKVLHNKFLKLEFQNKQKSGENEYIVFDATGFYKIINENTIYGNWFDSRGISFPLEGTINETELTIFWGNEDTEKGKTIYRYVNDNKITVEDFVMNNGEYFKFGNATYSVKDR